jgi:UPF0755 protein
MGRSELDGSRRTFARIALFLIGVSLILGAAAAIGWVALRQMRGTALQPGTRVDLSSLEKTLLGIYLNLRRGEIEAAAGTDNSPVPFTIQPGESGAAVAVRLERERLISDAELFRLVLRYWGVDAQIEAGDYVLHRNMPMTSVVSELQHGRVLAKAITLREGLRAEEMAHLLAVEGLVDQEEFILLVRDDAFHYDFLRDRPSTAPKTLEGFLFPDTYQFPANVSTFEVIDTLLRTFDQRVTIDMRQQALDRGLELYEVLTLASIVEREAVVAEERPIIASVYLNRLQIGMYLEADPTVQYAKGYDPSSDRWWPALSLDELRTVASAFNTFMHPGLPPGPICSPGLASVEAVLQPATTEYLFFHAKGDGSHAFAKTFDEHLENQGKY